jgi:hypothetical protein
MFNATQTVASLCSQILGTEGHLLNATMRTFADGFFVRHQTV